MSIERLLDAAIKTHRDLLLFPVFLLAILSPFALLFGVIWLMTKYSHWYALLFIPITYGTAFALNYFLGTKEDSYGEYE